MPVWHASVSSYDFPGVRILDVPRQTRRRAIDLALQLLDGIGLEGEQIREAITLAVHVRRKLSPAELAQLDPAWLACPAIDRGGHGTPV